MRRIFSQTLKKVSLLTAGFVLLAQAALPLTVLADGNGSPDACKDTTANVIGSQGSDPNSVTVNVEAGNVVTGVCIKSGSNMFEGNQHSGVLGNGTYEDGCYQVQGVGTSSVTVTRLKDSNTCQGISHIDVVTAPATLCYEQLPWWKVGKVYAEDVYTKNWQKTGQHTEWRYRLQKWEWKWNVDSWEKTEANVGKASYGSWDDQNTYLPSQSGYTTDNTPDNKNPDQVYKSGSSWYRWHTVSTKVVEDYDWVYTKIHSTGDPHPSLYGPYEVSNDPYTVPFNVGSGNHVIGDLFEYNETNYNDNNGTTGEHDGKVDYKYVLVSQGTKNGKRIPCEKPADKVEYSLWEEGEPNCDTKTVTPTRTKTVTPYVLAQDGYTWIPGTPVVTVESGEPRSLTSEELKNCTEKPDDKVTYGEWEDGEWECGDTTVTQTRTKTVTPYEWDGDSWELDADSATTTEEEQTRPLTEEEMFPCPPENACEIRPVIYLQDVNDLLALNDEIAVPNEDEDCFVGGHKFNDANGNNQYDEGEEFLSGFEFNLYSCTNSVEGVDTGEAVECENAAYLDTTTSDNSGSYSFQITENGTYMVCEVSRDGWVQTYPVDSQEKGACWMVTINDESCDTLDFGNKAKKPGRVLGEETPEPPVLVNTGASVIMGIIAGLSIIGAAGSVTYASRKQRQL